MSWTEFGALVDWLPMESRTKSAQRDDALDRRWGEDRYQRATMIVLLQMLIRITWAGRLEGQPPKMTPPTLPQTTAEIDELAAKREERQAKLAELRELRPTGSAPAPRVNTSELARRLAEQRPQPKRTS